MCQQHKVLTDFVCIQCQSECCLYCACAQKHSKHQVYEIRQFYEQVRSTIDSQKEYAGVILFKIEQCENSKVKMDDSFCTMIDQKIEEHIE